MSATLGLKFHFTDFIERFLRTFQFIFYCTYLLSTPCASVTQQICSTQEWTGHATICAYTHKHLNMVTGGRILLCGN